MKADELKTILEQHKLWLGNSGGKRADLQRADLQRADLQGANLQYADLQRADLQGADMRGANLKGVDMRGADLKGADLQEANLKGADLQGADLKGADLDYSCLPLWCGSEGTTVDRRLAAQIAAHFCVLDCDDSEYLTARAAILDFAKSSHRARELGLLEEKQK